MRTIDEILTATGGYTQGTQTNVIGAEFRMLWNERLIGPNGGLTRKGSIRAERLQSAQMDALFG